MGSRTQQLSDLIDEGNGAMVDINMSWVERLRAPRYLWSQIAAHNPQRGILCREQESQQQLLAWDVTTGDTRPITPPVPYTLNATLSPDGEFITYLRQHPTHQEVFQYVRVPYLGGDPQPMALTALMYASPHIEEAANERIGFTAVTGNGYSVQVWTPTSAKALFSFDSEILAYGPALSADGTIAVIATLHSDTSESTHLEAYNIDTGEKISQLEILDTPLEAVKFAPVMGDSRLLLQAREGLLTCPLIWDVRTGETDRLGALDHQYSYNVWDWADEGSIFLTEDTGYPLYFYTVYNIVDQVITDQDGIPDHPLLAYWHDGTFIFHSYEPQASYSMGAVGVKRESQRPVTLPHNDFKSSISILIQEQSHRGWYWNDVENPSHIPLNQRDIVVSLRLDKNDSFVMEMSAWIAQKLQGITIDLNEQDFDASQFESHMKHIVEVLQWSAETYNSSSGAAPLLTAHNIPAAFALLALHQNPHLWAGGVMVRPILDWVHLYENVSPPEKAMMRLWFGGSPDKEPHSWRAASPLRQTTPLQVPVKLLYHPYDSLTPIQHIQTYAANNPTVELIDISRDLVGPAHEQQERLITRMLQAGLPLLKPGT